MEANQISRSDMESRGRLRLAEKAEIIELYVYRKMTIREIAEYLSLSTCTISKVVSLYFKKPKKDVVKMSKV